MHTVLFIIRISTLIFIGIFTDEYITHRYTGGDKKIYLSFSEFKMYYNLNPDRYILTITPRTINKYNSDKYIIFNYPDFFKYCIFKSVEVPNNKKHCLYANNKKEYIELVILDINNMKEKAQSETAYANSLIEKINNNLTDNE